MATWVRSILYWVPQGAQQWELTLLYVTLIHLAPHTCPTNQWQSPLIPCESGLQKSDLPILLASSTVEHTLVNHDLEGIIAATTFEVSFMFWIHDSA
eukprot:scaffold15192_cov88-Cylindrotheca_fusiformis.AAC.1